MHSSAIKINTLITPALVRYVQENEKRLKELETSNKTLQFENLVLEEKLKLLTYNKFARSAEKVHQPSLFNEEETIETNSETQPEEITEVKQHKRRKNPNAGRKAIDAKIPRVRREIDIDESQKTCACTHEKTKIGEEISEKLHIIPMQIYVEQTVRFKYAGL